MTANTNTLSPFAAAAYAAAAPIAAAGALLAPDREDVRRAETAVHALSRGHLAPARVVVAVLQMLAQIGQAEAEAAAAAGAGV